MSGNVSCNATGGIGHERHEFNIFYSMNPIRKTVIEDLAGFNASIAQGLYRHIPMTWEFKQEKEPGLSGEGIAEYLHVEHKRRVKMAKKHEESLRY